MSGVLLLVAWLWAQAPAAPPAEALRLIEEGRAAEAIPLLEEAARKEPASAPVHFHLGYALSLAGQDERAIAAFRRVLELDPGLRAAKLNLAHLLVKAGRPAEARPLLEQCLEQQPDDAKAAFLLGRALADTGQWREAVQAFAKAAQNDPEDRDLAFALAHACERAGERARAAEIYARFPEDPAALERLGALELEAGNHEAAIRHLEAARQKSPTPAVLFALATAYLRNRQPEQAAAAAAALASAEPANADVRLFYGRILRDQKKYSEAAGQFEAATRLRPGSGEAWNEFTAMLMLLRRYDAALQALERARQINGDTPAYDYFRATMLDAMNQPKAALESYRKFLAASNGAHPEEEFKARQRVRILEKAAGR
ncbi:MAG: tetratricopeptide repeat protein [Bryobacteraceae bacterium]|nr:tetratricopeptide repeat protein [Bryobacteraceae bacterium]